MKLCNVCICVFVWVCIFFVKLSHLLDRKMDLCDNVHLSICAGKEGWGDGGGEGGGEGGNQWVVDCHSVFAY